MSFPFETDEENIAEESVKIPREYEIDFETGQFTGKIVEGLEAIKVWIYLALNTARYRYLIYSWDYGSEIEDLIGQSFTEEYIEVEAKRIVEECLLINENIISISDFSTVIIDDKLTISFTANTILGEVNINV
jgi:phage baseplate assembly protein W